jgi:amino acid transporter
LAADRLGVPAVVFFVMSAATPLTVVAGVVTTGFAVTGITGLPVAFVVIGAVLALFCVGYVSMARRVANAGAFYAYISQGIGRPVGVAGAWVALVAYNALQVGLYGAIGAATTPLLSAWVGLDVAWWVVALIAWVIVAVLGQLHVDVNGRVLAVLLVAEVAVIVSTASPTSPTRLAEPSRSTRWTPPHCSSQGWARSWPLLCWASWGSKARSCTPRKPATRNGPFGLPATCQSA